MIRNKEQRIYNRFKNHILRNFDDLDNTKQYYVLDAPDGYILMHRSTHEIKRYFYKTVSFDTLSQMNQKTKKLSSILIYFDGLNACKPLDELKQVLKDLKNKFND